MAVINPIRDLPQPHKSRTGRPTVWLSFLSCLCNGLKLLRRACFLWAYVPMALLGGWFAANSTIGYSLKCQPGAYLGDDFTSNILAVVSVIIGTMASLYAGTHKISRCKLRTFYLLFVIPYVVLNMMPDKELLELLGSISNKRFVMAWWLAVS